ncbi:unnamed protein product [Gordionus sp. m RMFG-2023]|uniref:sulfotransferase 1B1-like n=1 Tax=Gordionus sp. m RMFG-2023 TaxID=3053472 RepID=UPI0030E40CEB
MTLNEKYECYVKEIEEAHIWQGILYPGFLFKPEVLNDIQSFKVRKDDIFIATFPKSGTTWTAEIVSLIKSEVNIPFVKSLDISERVIHLETPPNRSLKLLEDLGSPRIFGTHLPFHLLPDSIKKGDCKVIYVMRNPKDVAVSFYHHHRMAKDLGNFSGSFKDFLALFSAGKTVCGSWFDHVIGYWEQTEKNILFLKYEDMKKNFRENIEKIADFLGADLSDEQIFKVLNHCSFESMQKNEKANRDWIPIFDKSKGNFMRKGIVGDWKNYFDQQDNQAFMSLYHAKMGQYTNLKFEFEIPLQPRLLPNQPNKKTNFSAKNSTPLSITNSSPQENEYSSSSTDNAFNSINYESSIKFINNNVFAYHERSLLSTSPTSPLFIVR